MKILVTGGAGFIGGHVCDALLDERHEVFVVDNLSTGLKDNLNKKAKFYEADITSRAALEKIFEAEKPEIVFHLAAQASVVQSVAKIDFDVKVNVIGTINILELAEKYDVKQIVFSSTGGAIYGDDVTRPTEETALADPVTPYGLDKLSAESYIKYFAKRSNLRYVILRYSNVYGPRQNPQGEAGVVAIFTAKMLAGDPVEIYGNGEQTRDYVFVGDVVKANLAAMKSKINGTYNIGTGIETSVNELAQQISALTKSKSQVTNGPPREEQFASSLNSNKAYLELGWKSEVAIEEGLDKTIQWYKK